MHKLESNHDQSITISEHDELLASTDNDDVNEDNPDEEDDDDDGDKDDNNDNDEDWLPPPKRSCKARSDDSTEGA